ncbi:MAG: hypothetical protein D6677_11215 [Calditrichaeota bacterium]|nr:MAG: hypothetical protein D6677_11215 [Calditrichota bacterium]
MARTKRKITSYTFLVVPDGKDATRSFTIRRWSLRLLTVLGLVVLVSIIIGFATYWKVADVALDYNRLKEENFELRSSLNRLGRVQADLERMRKINKKIRNSLSGYMQVGDKVSPDSMHAGNLETAIADPGKARVLFNSIPSLLPVDGFVTRGMISTDLQLEPHYGMDIAAPTGTAIRAPADGVVMFSDWSERSGNVLIIKHAYGFITVYKHNQRNLVRLMEKVRKGQVIALLGGTGQISSGPHLHFEMWHNNRPVDPTRYVGVPSDIKKN